MKAVSMFCLTLALCVMVAASGLSGSSSAAGPKGSEIARPDPDSCLGPIILCSQRSSFAALGRDIPMEEWKDLYCARLRSRDGSQLAILWFHYGDVKGSFSEIEVSKNYYVSGMPKSKPIIVDWAFKTESGIALGVHYHHVIRAKGRPTSRWATSKNIVVKYEFAPAKWSHPASTFNMPDYYAKYVFSKDSILTAFSFGFPYP